MTAPFPPPPTTPTAPPGARPPLGPASVIVTWLLVAALGVLALLASFFGMFLGMVSDGCMGGNPCNDALIGVGVLIASGTPWVLFLAAILTCAVRQSRRRQAWWVPLVAALLLVPAWALGAWVATLGVG